MATCHFCAEEIMDAATVCKHCGRELPSITSPAPTAATTDKRPIRTEELRFRAMFSLKEIGPAVVAEIVAKTGPGPLDIGGIVHFARQPVS